MHIGLITTSNELIDRITKLVAETRGAITVATNPNRAQEMLQSRDYAVRIIDRQSTAIPWTTGSCGECPIVNSLMAEDDLALVLEPGCYGINGRTARYRRDDIERLVGDVGAILARHAAEQSIEKELVGDTPMIQLVREMIQQIAPYGDISVMVLGETGTGKELVAKAIHRLSAPVAPFVAINCAAVPESLFESELFGHEAGAYTGARTGRPGLLEAAARGTMFLDEVGDMPMSLQGKLLRVLETRTFRRLGSNRDIPMEARIVCATNRNLETNLRPDLHYRLAGFTISIPPLRERIGDIGVLARTFLSQFTQRHDRGAKRLTDAAIETLRTHDWPGNARELRAVVERAAILSRGVVVESSDVVAALSRARRPRSSVPPPDSDGRR